MESRKETSEILSKLHPTDQFVDLEVTRLLVKYQDHPKACSFLKTIKKWQRQLCFHFTCKFFTAGHRTTQRVESTHSSLKGSGSLKSTLQKYNIVSLMKHLQEHQLRREAKEVQEIIFLISEGRQWSDYVEKHLDDEVKFGADLKDMAEKESGVFEVEENGKWLTVTFPQSQLEPIVCNCPTFSSRLLPCRHQVLPITRTKNRKFRSKENLYKRWYLDRHPLYTRAMKQLGLEVPTDCDAGTEISSPKEDLRLILPKINSILCPKRVDVRYAKLMERCRTLCDLASSRSFLYKTATCKIDELINLGKSSHNMLEADEFLPTEPLKRATNKRQFNEVKNLSSLSSKQKRKRVCGACGQKGHTSRSICCPVKAKSVATSGLPA